MIWYKDLYVGESIVHKTKKVKWKIMHNAGQIGIYVITLASNTQNLLDIIPSYELMQKGGYSSTDKDLNKKLVAALIKDLNNVKIAHRKYIG